MRRICLNVIMVRCPIFKRQPSKEAMSETSDMRNLLTASLAVVPHPGGMVVGGGHVRDVGHAQPFDDLSLAPSSLTKGWPSKEAASETSDARDLSMTSLSV